MHHMTHTSSHLRLVTTVLSLLGATGNAFLAANVISLYRSLRWDVVETEWESSYASWNFGIDSIKLLWAILSFYFSLSAVACLVGFFGALKNIKSSVKLYRDYSVVDLSLSALATLLFSFATFRPTIRSSLCEELSRHPELLRDLADAGLDVENCEPWFEKASVAVVGVMAIILVVRLQFTLAVSNYYSQLVRSQSKSHHLLEDGVDFSDDDNNSGRPRRIFLLPNRNQSAPGTSSNNADVVVYAPVPLSSLSPQETHDLDAAEAWFTRSKTHKRRSSTNSSKTHSPSRHHGHTRRQSSSSRIMLPTMPGEPLLPEYDTLQSPKREH